MELYTFQPFEIYEQLQRGESFRASPALCDTSSEEFDESWSRAYTWLTNQMDIRCPVPRPAGVTYPVWAWYWWAGPNRRKPDLRSSRYWADGGPAVLLTLDVPNEEVLLSEYHAWHHVLNEQYLGFPSDTDDFDARCETRGLCTYRNRPLPDPGLRTELEATWPRIFDFETIPQMLEYEREDSYVQATFWELRPEFVRQAVWFEKKGRSRKLELPTPFKAAA